MDLTIRDWMVIIGAGLILAVLVDAARRVYRERRSEVRLNAKITPPGDDGSDSDFNLLSELPNGGARIIRRDDLLPPEDADENGSVASDNAASNKEPDGDLALDSGPTAAAHQHNHASDRAIDSDIVVPGNTIAGLNPIDSAFDGSDSESPVSTSASIASAERNLVPEGASVKQAKDQLVGGFSSRDDQPETLDWLEQLEPDTAPVPEPDARLPRGIEPHVFVLNVVARADAGFSGKDVLHILLACDLRFGDMDFFHRHEQSAGRGPIQFSVSNMMKPGVFDIDAMSTLQTKGLMFFVTLPGPEDMLKAFDYMYETAKTVARNLNGDVLDETRSAVTPQSLEHMRQQIRELERRILVQSER